MERLWLVPTFAILTLLLVGPTLAFVHAVPGLLGFSLVLLAALIGVVFGIGLAGAAAFATVTNKPWRPRALRAAIVPLLVGLPVLAMAGMSKVPRIHDISTDPSDRLEFTPEVKALSMNQDAEGEERTWVETQQRQSYPDVVPIHVDLPPAGAFERAKAVADRMPGWVVTHADADAGRIEATATSRLFHFVDDVIVRVKPDGAGARIDVGSRARVGQSDLGANAARIEAFAQELQRKKTE